MHLPFGDSKSAAEHCPYCNKAIAAGEGRTFLGKTVCADCVDSYLVQSQAKVQAVSPCPCGGDMELLGLIPLRVAPEPAHGLPVKPVNMEEDLQLYRGHLSLTPGRVWRVMAWRCPACHRLDFYDTHHLLQPGADE